MAQIRIEFDPAQSAAYRSAGLWNDEVLGDWLARNASVHGQRLALRLGEQRWTHAQLRDGVARLANALQHLGVKRGEVVAVQLPNIPQFIFAYLAIAAIGAVMQTVHMAYRGADIEALLKHGGAVAVICMGDTADLATASTYLAMQPRLPAMRQVIVAGDGVPPGALGLAGLAASEPASMPPTNLKGSEAFLLLYTSGTTSSPKGVPHAYQDFLANARLSAEALAVSCDDTLLSAAPFTHLYGLFTVNLALASGAAIALLPVFSPPAFAEAIRVLRPSIGFTAPAHIAACMNGGLFDGLDLSCFRYVQISGSAVPPALGRALEPLLGAGRVMQLWGMTELQAGAYTRLGDALAVRTETTGRASPGTELRIVDAAGLELPVGEEGELQMRGPSLFQGYLDNQEATHDAFAADGWFRSGDLATLDVNGNLRLTGRVKDLINRGGVKFNPADVEALLQKHAAVAEVAVAPIPDAVLGERACCFVVVRPGLSLDFSAMQRHLADAGLSKFKWPERLEIVAAMPLTPTRKIIKARLVQDLLRRA